MQENIIFKRLLVISYLIKSNITVVEPKHKMYLNSLAGVLSITGNIVEPKHKMYLN